MDEFRSSVRPEGESSAQGGLLVTKIPTKVYNEQIKAILDVLVLDPGCVVSLTIDFSDEDSTVYVKARTPSGNVSSSVVVALSDDAEVALAQLLGDNRDAVLDELKLGVATTLMAAMSISNRDDANANTEGGE